MVKYLTEVAPGMLQATDRDGYTPGHIAAQGGHVALAEYIDASCTWTPLMDTQKEMMETAQRQSANIACVCVLDGRWVGCSSVRCKNVERKRRRKKTGKPRQQKKERTSCRN